MEWHVRHQSQHLCSRTNGRGQANHRIFNAAAAMAGVRVVATVPHQIAQRKVKRSEISTFEPNLSINIIL